MERCDFIKPLLYRIVEGEASPDEAMRVARHLPLCTVCRILLARERRLARMLEEDLSDLPVGEEFVQSVMATLPEEAPPESADLEKTERTKNRRQKRRRGLKLAGLASLLGSWSWVASQHYGFPGGSSVLATPELTFDSLQGSYRGLPALAQMVWVAIGALMDRVPQIMPGISGELGLLVFGLGLAFVAFMALVALVAMTATLGTSTFLVCAAGYLTRPSLGWIKKVGSA